MSTTTATSTTATMDEVIKTVSSKIGVDEAVARKAIGAVLNFLKENHGKVDFQAILSKLQGAEELMNEREVKQLVREGEVSSDRPAGGPAATGKPDTWSNAGLFGLFFTVLKSFGVLDIMKRLLQPIFGDQAVKLIDSVQDGAELTSVMSKLGIDRDQAVKVVQTLIGFMKEKLDPETIDQLTEQIPAVKAFLGDSKKEE